MPEKNLNFVKEPSSILRLLQQSQSDGTCIAIKSARLGDDIVITAVDELLEEQGRHKIILKHYDTSGYILSTNKIYLEEITSVCAFSTPFKNPIKDQLEKDRPWYF
jgi:hypothetical protein